MSPGPLDKAHSTIDRRSAAQHCTVEISHGAIGRPASEDNCQTPLTRCEIFSIRRFHLLHNRRPVSRTHGESAMNTRAKETLIPPHEGRRRQASLGHVPLRAADAKRSVQNILQWNTYLPSDCVRAMVRMGWDYTT